ncbi:erythrocyte membrane protein 1 [Plasmodium falciparum RAJ116]|uniref:Erythrocyte membrane protein 1 n=1 Tax=Plasmodium falciparum RAJ116 TaxID=580058 RepID=A0A0L0CSB5_PLAFA|nr:erythrocyte membrane protein 1 [Plasmodium falciparum RAJ116]
MGSQSSTSSQPSVVTNESHKSARNVLEEIGKKIKDKTEKGNNYDGKLKGKLSNAQFLDGLYRETGGKVRPGPGDSCSLDHKFHTNINNGTNHGRNPCDLRNQNRFGENAEAYCNSDKIRDNGERSAGGACVPFRRQNLCDKNLEFLDNNNTKTTHDLLGNVLVTAKYEGESIVKNHPNRGSSEVCIALARSFADIGDIVRGRDMFRSNEDVEKGLQVVFQKINKGLNTSGINDYNDENGNYYKLREAWWTANRDQVWKAITCSAPRDANYFVYKSDSLLNFSSDRCGHTEGTVPTNLDYVPQFLRWFEEWAEEFCRIRKIKLGKVKKVCRGEYDSGKKRYCSGEGYDCTQTDLRHNNIFVDLDCPNCEKACTSYKEWIENKRNEFIKQKQKYEIEINGRQKHDNNVNERYNKSFYDELKDVHEKHNSFSELLNKGKICENVDEKNKIDFNDLVKTFSRSEYCKSCPMLGVTCKGEQCNSLDDIKCTYGNEIPNRVTDKNNDSFSIGILLNDNKKKELFDDLHDFNQCDFFKRLRKQNWNCNYKCNLHVCELKNFNKEIDDEKVISIKVFIKRWLEHFLKDYNKIKTNLKPCINNETNTLCINGCYKNCDCVEKWIKKKKEEWKKIKDRYLKRYRVKNEDIADELKKFLKQDLFTNYVKNALEEGENLHNLKELVACDTSVGSDKKQCPEKDVINILLNRLKKKIETCKTQHDENKNNNSCKTLPPPLPRRRRGVLRRGLRRVRVPRARQVVKNDRGLLVGQEEVKETAEEEVEEEKEEEETPEEEAEVERPGPTATPVPELPGPPAPKNEEACEIVKVIFNGKSATDDIEGCKLKKNYEPWNCVKIKNHNNHNGACMPPRRQKLCVINLKTFREKTSVELRNAFIKCAAIETHFLWKYYKTKNPKAHDDLKKGTIPEKFKRQMFYTFGDYRDLCLDKNIGNDVSDVENYIKDVFSKDNKTVNGLTRETWCKTIENDVWKGMLCALSYNSKERSFKEDVRTQLTTKYPYSTVKFSGNNSTTLEEFAQTPQFLRWFIEWSDEFCAQRKEQIDTLKTKCKESTCSDISTKKICEKQCEAYKNWIKNWKDQYKKQSKKYTGDKNKNEYRNVTDITNSPQAYQYLHSQLKNVCDNEECKCMKDPSKGSKEPPDNTHSMPASLDDEPEEVGGRCTCKPPPKKPEVPPGPAPPPRAQPQPEAPQEPPPAPEGVGRSLKARDPTDHEVEEEDEDEEDEAEEEDEDDEDGDEVEESEEETASTTETTTQDGVKPAPKEAVPELPGPPVPTPEDACTIAEAILKAEGETKYKELCEQKFSGKKKSYPGWNCNSDIFKPGEQEGACMPPRRQKLYTKKIKDLKDETATETELRKAFIECAAIETFFSWHKFKMDNNGGDAEDKLNSGTIPEDFLRQMFYPFADYRDICLGNDIGNDVDEIEKKIKDVFTNGDAKDDQKRKNFWDKYGKDIWDGMVCGLSHASGAEKDTIKSKNTYETVTFIGGGPSSGIPLSDFAKIPTYFRYLEEWGESFCRERAKRLAQIKKDCKVEEDEYKCSGDGEQCDRTNISNKGLFADLEGPSCAKSCRSYRRWIERKKGEFDKQEKIYNQQKTKCQTQNKVAHGDKDNKQFCGTLENLSEAKDFLQTLKNGPCKNNNNGADKLDFTNPKETFRPAENCKPCSQFKINCRNGKCIGGTQNECNGIKTIDAKNFDTMAQNVKEFVMRVSDSNTTEFGDLKSSCENAGIFTGIKENKWKCRNVCGYDVCGLKSDNGENYDQIIIIRAFFKRWIEYFLEDYNIIRTKLKSCIENGNGSICTSDCGKKCDCVKDWITKKKDEWEKIKKPYLEQYKDDDQEDYNVKNILEKFEHRPEFKNAIKPCGNLNAFEKSCGLYGTDSPEKKGGKKSDIIDCMIKNLEKKIEECKKKPSGSKQCTTSPTSVEDEDDTLHDEIEVKAPNICPQQETAAQPEAEDEDGCDPAKTEPEAPAGPAAPASLPPLPSDNTSDILKTTIPFGIALALTSIALLFLKKKPKSPVDLIRVLDIPKGDYGTPTSKSKNRYIPYRSGPYKGKTYIYMEGDSDEDKYAFMSDTTDITSSESEYEELDINDIYVPGSPKYKTLIEVVLEPSKSNGNTPSKGDGNTLGDDMVPTTNTFTDEEWNELKNDFISQYIQSRLPMDVPQYDVSTELPMNIVGNVLDDGINEKPFITSIHDRNLYNGEEISYNINMNTNSMDDRQYVSNNVYSGIDLINDTLSGNQHIDIYDEVLKRKENELFGTKHPKRTSNNTVAKNINSDPIMNQLDLLHKWLDRHRDMCNTWNTKEELLDKLKEEWEQDNDVGHIPNDNKRLNTDVSIQIDMDNGKPKKEFTNMDNILDDLETYNEPFYDIYEDDIYYDVNDDENPFVDNIPMDHNKVDVPKKVHVEMKILNNTSTGSLEPEFPISDVWNI